MPQGMSATLLNRQLGSLRKHKKLALSRTLASTPRRKSIHLFSNWPEVSRRLHNAARVVLFLDFDGTLTPLRRRPDMVQLDSSVRALLRRLSRRRKVAIRVVSGRRLKDLRELVHVPGVICLGLHGWEGRRPSRSAVAARKLIDPARRLLQNQLRDLRGIWIKDKGPCFAVHYRGAPTSEVRRARIIVQAVLRPLRRQVRLLSGKKIWEFLPLALEDKGAAVTATLRRFPGDETLAVYVGDDTTDESAFAALPGGITVRVGKRKLTRAHFSLRNPEEVKRFLQKVEAELD